jgi:hypothetical protein
MEVFYRILSGGRRPSLQKLDKERHQPQAAYSGFSRPLYVDLPRKGVHARRLRRRTPRGLTFTRRVSRYNLAFFAHVEQ